MELKAGDLIEVLADDPKAQYWYGELIAVDPVTVNYISPFKGDVWRFDEAAYHVDKESINYVVDMSNKSKSSGWKELGYVYRGDHEIIHADDVDSEEDDEDWVPGKEDEEEEDEDEDDSDEVNSDDDSVEAESEPEDVINSDDDDDEEEEEEEEEEESEEVPQKKRRKSSKKA